MYRYLTLVLLLLGHSGVAQECPAPKRATPFVIHVTHEEFPIASLKSRLVRLLTDSLIDQGRGLVDIARERQIEKLMKQLRADSFYNPRNPRWSDDADDARHARADHSAPTNALKVAQF